MWPGPGQQLPHVYCSHPAMQLREFGVGVPCDDVLTKSTLSRQSCAHLVPPLLCLPLHLLLLLHSPALSSCSSPRVSYSFEVTTQGVLETLRIVWRSSFTATMVHSSGTCRFFLLMLLGLMVAFVHTGKPPFECDGHFVYFCGFDDESATCSVWATTNYDGNVPGNEGYKSDLVKT